MTDTGFVLVKMNNDPIYDTLLQTIKEVEKNNPTGQTIIFNSYCDKINLYNLPILHLSKAQFFEGNLFIFDLPSVILTKNFPNVKKKILYTTSAQWSGNNASYDQWESLYLQDSLDILTNSQSLYDLYSICWKTPIGISERFSYEEISKFL